MKGQKQLFNSARPDWRTPKWLFDKLNAEFNFDCDVAASSSNALCKQYFTEETDALKQPRWAHRNFLNPPYGRQIGNWIALARHIAYDEETECVVLLLPARTDTKWFHMSIAPYSCDVRFVKGRLKFDGGEYAAPFPSMIVVMCSSDRLVLPTSDFWRSYHD